MASKPLSQLHQDEVMCSICLEQFEDPRMFSCMHTYCKHCLEPLLKNDGTIKCPQCNEIFQISSVNTLKVNFWANKFIAVLQWGEAKDKIEHDGGEAKLKCNNCVDGEAAQVRCFDCEKNMCKSCLSKHNLMGVLTKFHTVMTLDEIIKEGFPVIEKPTFCERHKGKKKKLFCKGCELLICKDCTVDDHKDHSYHFNDTIIGDYKEKITSKIKTASTTEERINVIKKSLGNKMKSVMKNNEETELHINEIVDEQIQALEDKRLSLKADLKAMTESQINNLSLQKSDFELYQACLKSAISFADNALAKGSTSEILSVAKDITSRLSQLSTKPFMTEDKEPLAHTLEVDEKVQETLRRSIGKIARVFEFDPHSVDPQQSEVEWKSGEGFLIHINNASGEHIDIDENRIDVSGCPRRLNVLQEAYGVWFLNINGDQSYSRQSYMPTAITVKVDGKAIKNGNDLLIH